MSISYKGALSGNATTATTADNLKSNATTGVIQIAGPTAGTTRVMTVPDANATLIYSGGALGTPASGTLTNCTGLPVAGGGTGASTLTDHGVLLGSGTDAITPMTVLSSGQILVGVTSSDPHALAAGTTSQILVGGGAADPVWTAATGTGSPVRATSPTLITPALGTPASGTLTNCTGTASNLTAGYCSRSVTGTGSLGGGGALSSDITISMNTPGTCTSSSTNSAASNHTHAITNYSVTGTSGQITVTGAGKVLGEGITLSLPSSVGINTTTPTATLDVNSSIIRLRESTSAPTLSNNGDFSIGSIGTGNTDGRVWIRSGGNTFRFLSYANSADYSEFFYDNGITEPGDLVMIDVKNHSPINGTGRVKKTDTPYQNQIVGVVTENDRGTGGNDPDPDNTRGKDPDFSNVGLLGHIYTKVSTINGVISEGDPLTSSSIPGVAMKATKSGYIIGWALEGYNNSDSSVVDKIIAFIRVSWYGLEDENFNSRLAAVESKIAELIR